MISRYNPIMMKWRHLCARAYSWRVTWGNRIDTAIVIGLIIAVWVFTS